MNPEPAQTQMKVSAARAMQAMRANRPLRAEEICRDYLLLNPGCIDHLRLLGHALMKQNRLEAAERELRRALSLRPDLPQLYADLGSVLALGERFEEAIPLFREAIKREPGLALAHKKLGQALAAAGRGAEADEHFGEFLDKDPGSGQVAAGVEHLRGGRTDEAIAVLRAVLQGNPEQIDAMRYLALAYARDEQSLGDAEAWLRRATELAPDYTAAWLDLALVLLEMAKHMDAIDCYRCALQSDPDNPAVWAGLANAYALASYPEKSVAAFEKSLALEPDAPGVQMSYAHSLKTLGRQKRAIQAYREAIRLKPDFGEAYWSMANLKTFRFDDGEVEAMRQQLGQGSLNASQEIHFNFALAQALEDAGNYDAAWHHYHNGNRKQRMQVAHDPLGMEKRHNEIMAVFTEAFLAEHADQGDAAPDPILIVGLPRSGSTLVEQILASHSEVEGTSELPILNSLANTIGRYRPGNEQFPKSVLQLKGRDWRAYGQQYMDRASRHRATDKPRFTDKLPNNFPFVGLLHLVLPNAKVINARRHPLDSCLGGYKQLFARGQHFTYDMEELAHYYQCYERMIAHWQAVLPGKVLDVHYEDTVCDLERQVGRILEHCELPFEEGCLRFFETRRAVKTASSEQVRQPIYTGALGMWRNYEPHIGLWVDALSDLIEKLPPSVRRAAG